MNANRSRRSEGRACRRETQLGPEWPSELTAIAVLALAGASSIEEIMTILPSVCLKPLKGRSCACFSSACMHAYNTRELRTHTLSGLPSTETGSYADSASSPVSLQDMVSPLFMRTATPHISVRTRKRICWANRRRLGVCVSVSGTVKCGWNMLIRPHRSLRWVQLDSEFQMGRDGRALIAGTQGRLL
jgi:hypothetical protein